MALQENSYFAEASLAINRNCEKKNSKHLCQTKKLLLTATKLNDQK